VLMIGEFIPQKSAKKDLGEGPIGTGILLGSRDAA